jgi:hypothetical protein
VCSSDLYKKIVDSVTIAYNAGQPAGSATRMAEAQANLAAAEIELYRHTGEQDKLHTALQARVEFLTVKLRAVVLAHEAGTTLLGNVGEAEIQLLDALLEQKRAHEIDPKRVPKIVRMFPENGAKNVDPNISQVYLTFDIPMGNGRAWASNNADGTALDHDPDTSVFWTADKLTCVAPVKLLPNKRYVVYLNIRPFIGFASVDGVPSAGLTYSFETGSDPLDEERRKELAKDSFELPAAMKKGRPWSPGQATGEPDAWLFKTGGDYIQAWASLTPDGQEEWLELTWDEPLEAVGVDVYETYNPGALVRVIAYKDDVEVAKWEGIDPTPRDAPDGKGISKIRFDKLVSTAKIRLILDSANVPGWNEIDAVGLVDTSGTVHWATGATASSTYADVK